MANSTRPPKIVWAWWDADLEDWVFFTEKPCKIPESKLAEYTLKERPE